MRPADGQIRSTVRNDSAGAKLIVELSRAWSRPTRPLVVLACAPLTTLADAYLIDETVVDRVVVVAVHGEYTMPPTATMDGPNRPGRTGSSRSGFGTSRSALTTIRPAT